MRYRDLGTARHEDSATAFSIAPYRVLLQARARPVVVRVHSYEHEHCAKQPFCLLALACGWRCVVPVGKVLQILKPSVGL